MVRFGELVMIHGLGCRSVDIRLGCDAAGIGEEIDDIGLLDVPVDVADLVVTR